MKRIIAKLSIAAVVVALLAGCSTIVSGDSGTHPVDLTKSSVISALCGDKAASVEATVASAAQATPTSPHRLTLSKWGIKDPSNDKAITKILTTLKQRAMVKCDSSSKNSNASKASSKLTAEEKALLDASRIPVGTCQAIVKNADQEVAKEVYALKIDQLPAKGQQVVVNEDGNPNHLQWSNALGFPLQGNTPEEKYAYLQLVICTHPVLGVSLAHLFAHLSIEGTSVLAAQHTDWLQPFKGDTSTLSALVDKYMPYSYLPTDGSKPSETQYTDAAKATKRYATVAGKLVYLLSLYQFAGDFPINSHYSYEAMSLVADGAPAIGIDTGLDNRPALVFYFTSKTSCVATNVLAFNDGDTRPELGEVPQSCTTGHTPGCEQFHNCTLPHCVYNPSLPPYSPECLEAKDPTKDVGANPNVNPFLQDGGEKHSVSNGDGAKVANGYQGSATDVTNAQNDAASDAADKSATDTTNHDAAVNNANVNGGGVVNSDQNKGVSGSPAW